MQEFFLLKLRLVCLCLCSGADGEQIRMSRILKVVKVVQTEVETVGCNNPISRVSNGTGGSVYWMLQGE